MINSIFPVKVMEIIIKRLGKGVFRDQKKDQAQNEFNV